MHALTKSAGARVYTRTRFSIIRRVLRTVDGIGAYAHPRVRGSAYIAPGPADRARGCRIPIGSQQASRSTGTSLAGCSGKLVLKDAVFAESDAPVGMQREAWLRGAGRAAASANGEVPTTACARRGNRRAGLWCAGRRDRRAKHEAKGRARIAAGCRLPPIGRSGGVWLALRRADGRSAARTVAAVSEVPCGPGSQDRRAMSLAVEVEAKRPAHCRRRERSVLGMTTAPARGGGHPRWRRAKARHPLKRIRPDG